MSPGKHLVLFSLLATFLRAGAGKHGHELPKDLPVCNIEEEKDKVNDCLLNAIQAAVPIFRQGIRQLDVLPMDPLEITELQIGQGSSSPVNLDLKFTNLMIHGMRNMTIKSVDFDPETYTLEIKVTTGTIKLEGPYVAKGKVLLLPIYGDGLCNITLDNLRANATIKSVKVKKDNEDKDKEDKEEYLDVQDFSFKFETDHMYLHFEHLFDNDKKLGDSMNKFLNENWDEILKELQDPIEQAFGASFKEITNRVFSRVPVRKIFLKS